ncbi:hypothetical protein C7M84_004748 [Penaeus vannamei]|uniref:Uncharacterized protein n=1 Tax=Penaeus vannamei TaxID=6689 RepID=A0A3R7QSI8_PENVA|nr:hypothetical protein C7M84_004748 [Penaeus vannamei]
MARRPGGWVAAVRRYATTALHDNLPCGARAWSWRPSAIRDMPAETRTGDTRAGDGKPADVHRHIYQAQPRTAADAEDKCRTEEAEYQSKGDRFVPSRPDVLPQAPPPLLALFLLKA